MEGEESSGNCPLPVMTGASLTERAEVGKPDRAESFHDPKVFLRVELRVSRHGLLNQYEAAPAEYVTKRTCLRLDMVCHESRA